MRITPKRALAATAGLLAVAGAVVVLPADAGAQPSPTLTIEPPVIEVGQSAGFVASGCTDSEIPQESLEVVFTFLGEDISIPTEEDGTAATESGNAPEGAEGEYPVTASCVNVDGPEGPEVLFEYDEATLTVIAGTTPTTGAPTTTTAPPAAAAAEVTPAFTG